MKWRFPQNPPETVHIFGITKAGGEMAFDPQVHLSRDLRDCPDGLTFSYAGIKAVDVRRVTLCVFLDARNIGFPNIRAVQSLGGGYFVNVIIGRAHVLYDVASKPGGELTSHKISLRSSASFDAGILGYTYIYNGKSITLELPGTIGSGKKEYPPVFLAKTTGPPAVCLAGGYNTDVLIERRKATGARRRSSGR